jgi:hypothetical protein
MRLTVEEIAWLDGEVQRLNAPLRDGRTNLGRPKYAYGRADVVRDLRRRVEQLERNASGQGDGHA